LEYCTEALDKVEVALDEEEEQTQTIWLDKESEAIVIGKSPRPDLVIRYEANIERQIARTLGLLEQWRRMRNGGSGPEDGL
jgi:hypothetical protein